MGPKARYPAASYRRLFDPSLSPLWSPQVGLPPDEDGDHYRPERDFFEWWYFDAALDNGYRLVVILHSSLYNAVDHKPTVDIRLTPPGGKSRLFIGRYSRAEYRAAADHCDVQIGGCRAVAQDAGRYTLSLRQGEIAAGLTYQSRLPGWRPGSGYLFFDQASGHFFKWVVPLPRAQVTGTLTLDGQTQTVQGVGYHDHNWGNFVLADAFSHWYWGRLFDGSGSQAVVFGDVVGRGPEPVHIRPFLLIAGGEILPGEPQVAVQAASSIAEPITGVRYPCRLDLSATMASYRARVSLAPGQVMEALDFASPPFRQKWPRQAAEIAFYLLLGKPILGQLARRLLGKGSYLRLAAQADASVETSQTIRFDGEAIFEIMQFQ
ncbi:MAG: lipocalin-like domain-containing protein [Chloroflexota bacterium]